MTPEKINFLKNEFMPLMRNVDPSAKPNWGKMSLQQMVEHMSESIRIANGKSPHQLHTPADSVSKFKAFMMSEKPFKEHTKNALMGDEPPAIVNASISKALDELQTEVNDFFNVFESHPGRIIANPFFGDLNFSEWVQLLHKHAVHHLKQFGVNT